MDNLRLYLLLLFTLCINLNSGATEIIGGSLRYEALGNQQYKVIGTINRNCGDSALALPIIKIYALNEGPFNLGVTRTYIKDITLHCKASSAPCSPSNTQTNDGQEQHTFEATVDFSTAPFNNFYTAGKCQVFFSIEACCRSKQTTNITANSFYLEAMLNLCALGSSLENSNSTETPVTYYSACGNIPFASNLGYNDKDGDSLFHHITIPKKSKDSFELFNGQCNIKYPMTPFCVPSGTVNCPPLPSAKPPRGFYFDSTSGYIVVTPTDINERAIIDIRTTEFRKINNKMTIVGYSTTELFIKVLVCSDNNPPTIPTVNKYSVCEGNKLCFTIQSNDAKAFNQTIDDTTSLIWNNGIPGATFTIVDPTAREKSAQFCWQTKIGDANPVPYQFSVTAFDNNCTAPLQTVKGFLITVKPKAKADRQYNQPVCGKLIFKSVPKDNGNFSGNYSYTWSIKDSSNSGLPLYQSFKSKDSFIFTKKGKYVIMHTINNLPLNCPAEYMDTVVIKCIGGGPNSITSITSSNKLNVYPNPTKGLITIDLNKNANYKGMKLINNLGQVIYSGAVTNTFDMRDYASGVYTLEVMCEDVKYIAQIIKN